MAGKKLLPHAEVQRSIFFRRPDWRYLRALTLARSKGQDRGYGDDDETRQLARYLKSKHRNSAVNKPRTVHCNSHMLAAFQIFVDPKYERLKYEIELRCLAEQSTFEISNVTALPLAVLDHYERTNFDVRDRLASAEYTFSMVIDEQDSASNAMKKLAYCIGPAIIDVLLTLLPMYISLSNPAEVPNLKAAAESHPLLGQLMSDGRQSIDKQFSTPSGAEPPSTFARIVDVDKSNIAGVIPAARNLPNLMQLYERLAG